MIFLNGKDIQETIKNELTLEVRSKNLQPCLAIVQVGNCSQSDVYVNQKKIHARDVGIKALHGIYEESISEEDLIKEIGILNRDPMVNGIIVQLPLPKHLNEFNILEAIDPMKDVDCMTSTNIGLLHLQKPRFKPCTPNGIVELMERYNIKLQGKNVLIIGRSNIVSRPLAEMLIQKDCTVTIAHSKTIDLKDKLKNYDVIVSAIGKANFLTTEDFKDCDFLKGILKKYHVDFEKRNDKQILIDIGINRDSQGKLCGDISKDVYDNEECNVSHITPVPNGVGRMTVACLLKNVVLAYQIQNNIK